MNASTGSRPLGLLVAVVAFSIAHPVAALDERSALWVSDLQRVEEMISASIETQDAAELKRQTFSAYRLTGRASSEVFEGARLACTAASSALANVANDLQGGSQASALVSARADAKIYFRNMADCEKSVGVKGKRPLKLRL